MKRFAEFFGQLLVSSSLLVTVSWSANAAPMFMGLGHLPGGNASQAFDVSADGSTVVGNSDTGVYWEAFYWTQDEGMVSIGDLSGDSTAWAVSGDGSVIAGNTGNHGAFRWTADEGMVSLGADHVGDTEYLSHAYGISHDGSVIVGVGTVAATHLSGAVRWTQEEMRLIGLNYGGEGFAPYDVSGDGAVITGKRHAGDSTQPFRWTAEEGMVLLGHLPGMPGYGIEWTVGEAISADGSVIVGESEIPSGEEAFRWTEEEGMVSLGPGHAYDVSADGSFVVGNGGPAAIFIWDEEHGMRDIVQVLSSLGLDLTGWSLYEARGISDDGLTIVGIGTNPSGFEEAWIATIPEPATALLVACGLVGLGLKRRPAA